MVKLSGRTVVKAFLLIVFALLRVHCAVVINEIQYNPRQSSFYEYIELYNSDAFAVNLTKWKFTDGIDFIFPSNSSIAANSYVLIVADVNRFRRVYPSVSRNTIYGPYNGSLSNSGERLTLLNTVDGIISSFKYEDKWYPLTDGYGASLELMCHSSNPKDATNWRASTSPLSNDPLLEFSGTPGRINTWTGCPPPSSVFVPPPIRFSEIMYRPVLEGTSIKHHEWFEIYNDQASSVDVSGWRILSGSGVAGSLQFKFPANTTLAPNSFTIIAKNINAFKAVWKNVTSVYGNYSGELGNGDDLAIVDNLGQLVEDISFNNKFPWPLGADALFETMPRYTGLALSRVSYDISGHESYNWIARAGTPGVANYGSKAVPDPVVTDWYIRNVDTPDNPVIIANKSVLFSFNIAPADAITQVTFEFFIYDAILLTNGTIQSFNILKNGSWFNYTKTGGWGNDTIIRWRLRASFPQSNVIYPRSNDGFEWDGMFVAPNINKSIETWHTFINPTDWTTMYENVQMGVFGVGFGNFDCDLNPNWNNRVPAIFAYQGRAFPVQVRYQGSFYRRISAINSVSRWNVARPTKPSGMPILSWAIKLPSYIEIDGSDELTLQKPSSPGCTYISNYVMFELLSQVNQITGDVRFGRYYINGQQYNYAMKMKNYDTKMLRDHIAERYNLQCDHQSSEVPGVIYKSSGYGKGLIPSGNEGWPAAYNNASCARNWTSIERIPTAYAISNFGSWATYDDFINLIDQLSGPNKVNWLNNATLGRDWFEKTFDLNQILTHIAIVNWAGAWDDVSHNHFLYKRATDGKWTLIIADLDGYFIQYPYGNSSMYFGEGANFVKYAAIRLFRAEYNARWQALSKDILSNANVAKALQSVNNVIEQSEISFLGINVTNCLIKMQWAQQNRSIWSAANYNASAVVDSRSICPAKPTIVPNNTFTLFRTVPAVPSVVKMGTVSVLNQTYQIKWDPVPSFNGGEVVYIVEKKCNDTTFNQIYNGTATSFQDSLEENTTTCTYRVKASNSMGASNYGSEITVNRIQLTSAAATTSARTTSGTTGSQSSSDNNDDEDNLVASSSSKFTVGSTYFYVVVIGGCGLILIAVVITVVVLVIKKRKSGGKQNESIEMFQH